jgi:hypothetical protein
MFKYILIGLLFIHSFGRTQGKDSPNASVNKEAVIKKIISLSSKECLFWGHGADPTDEEIENLNTITNLSLLSFEDLKPLLNATNPYTKIYGFNAICQNYPDSLNEDNLNILRDSTKVFYCMRYTIVDVGLTISSITKESYNQITVRKSQAIKKQEIEKKIKEFILEYAEFPDSYKPIEFKDFILSSTFDPINNITRENSEGYEILHTYRIKDKQGKETKFSHYFILEYDFSINIIESTRTDITWVSNPEIELWLEVIGRKLTRKDLTKLKLE